MRGELGFPVRLRFTKRGKVRFISHRDAARALERAFRIEQLPLAFTQGFSPRPKVSFGLALGVGHESVAEYLDLELAEVIDVGALDVSLSAALPDGIDVTGAVALIERAPSLQESVTAVEYDLSLSGLDADALGTAAERALASESLPVTTTRKGQPVVEDLRPSLRRLVVETDDDGTSVARVDATTQPRGVRPADLLRALRELADAPEGDGRDRVLRTNQWIERDGARLEPLEADRATHTATPVRVMNKGRTDDRRDHSGGDRLRVEDPGAGTPDARRIA